MAKADNYSFLKKLVENVKETKDAQAPDDEEVNKVKQKQVINVAYPYKKVKSAYEPSGPSGRSLSRFP